MIRQYTFLGIIICFAIALAALPIRLSTDENISNLVILKIVSYTFTVSLFSFFTHLYFSNKKPTLRYPRQKHLMSFLHIIVIAIAIVPIDAIFDNIFGFISHKDAVGFNLKKAGWILLLLRSLMISVIYYFIIFGLKLVQEKQQRSLEIEKLIQAQLEAKLSNLKEQMSPHFLFNTLNTLSSITSEKPVKDYIFELANVYRYMLVHNKMKIVSLKNELNFITSYLYIIKTRMGASINITINLSNEMLDTQMPPLTLQLLLENATKHNVASVNHPLHINISNDDSYIVVSNSLKTKTSTQYSTGVGLTNLMSRYTILFSKNILIEKNNGLFIVKMPIIKP